MPSNATITNEADLMTFPKFLGNLKDIAAPKNGRLAAEIAVTIGRGTIAMGGNATQAKVRARNLVIGRHDDGTTLESEIYDNLQIKEMERGIWRDYLQAFRDKTPTAVVSMIDRLDENGERVFTCAKIVAEAKPILQSRTLAHRQRLQMDLNQLRIEDVPGAGTLADAVTHIDTLSHAIVCVGGTVTDGDLYQALSHCLITANEEALLNKIDDMHDENKPYNEARNYIAKKTHARADRDKFKKREADRDIFDTAL